MSLTRYGIRGYYWKLCCSNILIHSIKIIKSYLFHRTFQVKLGNHFRGLKQTNPIRNFWRIRSAHYASLTCTLNYIPKYYCRWQYTAPKTCITSRKRTPPPTLEVARQLYQNKRNNLQQRSSWAPNSSQNFKHLHTLEQILNVPWTNIRLFPSLIVFFFA